MCQILKNRRQAVRNTSAHANTSSASVPRQSYRRSTARKFSSVDTYLTSTTAHANRTCCYRALLRFLGTRSHEAARVDDTLLHIRAGGRVHWLSASFLASVDSVLPLEFSITWGFRLRINTNLSEMTWKSVQSFLLASAWNEEWDSWIALYQISVSNLQGV